MTYSATGLVLRRTDVREWDRLYTVLTREHGKLLLVGKGTRRPKAKLAAHCEPLAEVDFEIARGRQMDRIIFARTTRTNEVFATSHTQFALASFCCECVDALTKDAHPDPELFDFLRDGLNACTTSSFVLRPSSFVPPFLLRLLTILGYAPILDRCVECRRVVPDGRPALGIPWRGGVVCVKCSSPSLRTRGEGEQEGERWSDVIVLKSTDRALLSACVSSFTPQPITPPVATFADQLLAAHLPRPLRTFQFILSEASQRA